MAAERGGAQDPDGPLGDGGGVNVPIPGGPVDGQGQPGGTTLPTNLGGPNFAGWDAPTWAANMKGVCAGERGTGANGIRRTVRGLRRTSSEPPVPNP